MGTWLLQPTTGVTLASLLDQLIQFTSKRRGGGFVRQSDLSGRIVA
jgi:hypothetical protein